MITTILWDVDGTLLDFHYSQSQALRKCFETADLTFTQDILKRYDQINDSYWKRLELGEITKAQLLNGRFVTLFEEYGITGIDVEQFRKEYQYWLGTIYAYIDDSLNVCKALRNRVKQYVITNGVSATQRNKLKLSGFADVMEDMFISEEIGTPKPGIEFFEAVLGRIEEKDKNNILVVGDSLSSDIKGGRNASLKTCWYRPEGTENLSQWKADYEISDLHQVEELIG